MGRNIHGGQARPDPIQECASVKNSYLSRALTPKLTDKLYIDVQTGCQGQPKNDQELPGNTMAHDGPGCTIRAEQGLLYGIGTLRSAKHGTAMQNLVVLVVACRPVKRFRARMISGAGRDRLSTVDSSVSG